MQSETNATTQQIVEYLFSLGAFPWRQDVTGIPLPYQQGMRPAGKKGVSDILACLPPGGRLVAIEVKTGKDRLSPEQKGFLGSISTTGGIALVARSFDDFLAQWKKL